MRIAIHQPNLASWFPYFYKMEHCDTFIIMIHCQFEKNGYQNRANVYGKWWTVPVNGGMTSIKDKLYCNGSNLVDANVSLILGWAKILGIDTRKIHYDFSTDKRGTDRIIELCKKFDCDQYVTNPDAIEKYLDVKLMNDSGIELYPITVPPQYHKSIYELFNDMGIEEVQKLIKKDFSRCKI